jgi:hypothetical protein
MRIARHALVVAGAGWLALTPVAVASAQVEGADLSVNFQSKGKSPVKARAGQTIALSFRITNTGPETAENVLFRASGASDHFNVDGVICEENPSTDVGAPCGDLAPGETARGTLVLHVCCFVRGEIRQAFASAEAVSSTNDPNPGNNEAAVSIRMVGPPES